jgi:hypothetical protein
MSNLLVKKFKWFWQWQDDKEEAWLGEMARQGLHLQKMNTFGGYSFVQGKLKDVAYRLDFVKNARKTSDYFQLFQDAGWERVGEMGGWQYWSKDIQDDKVPEIFTDNESKIRKYQHLLAFFTISIPLFIFYMIDFSNPHTHYHWPFFATLENILYAVFFVLFMSFFFSMFMILRRISELKRKQ